MKQYITLYKAIIKLGTPILIGQIGIIVTAFADNIMVGRYSTEALASASFVNNVFNVAFFSCMGFSYGLTPLIGALYGRNKKYEVGEMLSTGLILNIAFGVLVTLLMTLLYFNIDKMGQPSELLPIIRPYYILMLCGLVPVIIFSALSQWLFAINKPRLPMWIVLSSNIINIAGNYILIYGNYGLPELGLTGAGYATLIARLFCMTMSLVVLLQFKNFNIYRQGFLQSSLSKSLYKVINKTSWPVTAQMACESGCFTMTAVMSGWLGTLSLAAYQIIVIIGTLGFCVYYSIGSAISVVVSNKSGINDHKSMRRAGVAGYHIMLGFATVACLLFYFFDDALIGFFTTDTEVITLTSTLILPLILYQLSDATQICFANSLRGTGKVMPMLWIGFICYIIIGIPAAYILGISSGIGIYGILLSFTVCLSPAAFLYLYFFLRATRN